MSAASLVTLSPRAFDALLPVSWTADVAICRPRCITPLACVPAYPPSAATCPPTPAARDVLDCGLLLQQALREIDLLRSGLENAADLRARHDTAFDRAATSCDASSSRSATDRDQQLSYAARPIGEMPPRDPQRIVTAVDQVITIRMITNLGTLIDALI